MTDQPAPRTRVEATYNGLREDIISGRLEPGSRLAVERLRKRYDVGSSTIREALSLLISDALVTAEGQRGFTVRAMSTADLRDISNVRILLASTALAQSIEHGDDDWEALVVAAFHRLSKAQTRLDEGAEGAAVEWERRNREFHDALTSQSVSPWIRHVLDMLHHHSERYRRHVLDASTVPRDVHAEHEALLNAALERDEVGARRIVTEHIERTTDVIAALLDGDSISG